MSRTALGRGGGADEAGASAIQLGINRRPWVSDTLRSMNIYEWWPRLQPATQEWLVANNGDVIPADIVGEMVRAGRTASTDQLGDDEIDWIEAVANGEEPGD